VRRGRERFEEGRLLRVSSLFVLSVVFFVACKEEPKAPTPISSPARGVPNSNPADSSSQRVRVTQGDVTRTLTLKTQPIVDGCSMEGAMKTLSSRHDHVRVCASNYAKKHGGPPAGRIVVSLSLKKNGDVAQSAVTEDPVGDPELNACLKEAIRVRFPNPYGKNCIVQAPFQFTAKALPKPGL